MQLILLFNQFLNLIIGNFNLELMQEKLAFHDILLISPLPNCSLIPASWKQQLRQNETISTNKRKDSVREGGKRL